MRPQSSSAQIQDLEDKCKQSIQNSLQLLNETNAISVKTENKLAHQSEKLDSVLESTAVIHKNLDTSQKLLNGMKSFWSGLFYSEKKQDKKTTVDGVREGTGEKKGTKEKEGQKDKGNTPLNANSKTPNTASVGALRGGTPPTLTQQAPVKSFDEIYNQGLDDMSKALDELSIRSKNINSTIKQHNEKIGKINTAVEKADERINNQRKQLNKL